VPSGLGRPIVLLWLAAAAEDETYRRRLGDLGHRGVLTAVALTRVERRHLAALVGEPGRARGPEPSTLPMREPVAGGAELEVHLVAGDMEAAFARRLASHIADLPVVLHVVHPARELRASEDLPRTVVEAGLPVGMVGRMAGPGGLETLLRLTHEDGERALAARGTRRWLVWGGIVSLVLISVLGLVLTRRAVARERAARRLRDDFIANVTHEVRTPLTSVLLHSELLLDPEQPAGRRASHARVVQAQGQRLAALVDGLLDFAAPGRGARHLEPGPVDLARAAEEAAAPYRVLAEREGRELHVDVPAGEVVALADATALARILANLVANAWKHGVPPRGGGRGYVRVRVPAHGPPAVDVSDDGPGVPAAEREAVFERFARSPASKATAGAGIGLSLSRDLARAMDGDLALDDDGEATVFRLTLPTVPEMTP
jgi:signal transduction histidine kinase